MFQLPISSFYIKTIRNICVCHPKKIILRQEKNDVTFCRSHLGSDIRCRRWTTSRQQPKHLPQVKSTKAISTVFRFTVLSIVRSSTAFLGVVTQLQCGFLCLPKYSLRIFGCAWPSF